MYANKLMQSNELQIRLEQAHLYLDGSEHVVEVWVRT